MFHLADLEKMSSLERISFLQEKLQDIRNHYLSLKSEVASIDRRRKRMKKKERESESALCDLNIADYQDCVAAMCKDLVAPLNRAAIISRLID